VSQEAACFANFVDSNSIAATTTDPSGVASVRLTASGPAMTSPANQTMTSGGGSNYFASIGWSNQGTYSWTVSASDANGNTSTSSGSFVVKTSCP
jgi:hypothetical protein